MMEAAHTAFPATRVSAVAQAGKAGRESGHAEPNSDTTFAQMVDGPENAAGSACDTAEAEVAFGREAPRLEPDGLVSPKQASAPRTDVEAPKDRVTAVAPSLVEDSAAPNSGSTPGPDAEIKLPAIDGAGRLPDGPAEVQVEQDPPQRQVGVASPPVPAGDDSPILASPVVAGMRQATVDDRPRGPRDALPGNAPAMETIEIAAARREAADVAQRPGGATLATGADPVEAKAYPVQLAPGTAPPGIDTARGETPPPTGFIEAREGATARNAPQAWEPVRADPRMPMAQIAETIRNTRDGTVEISLQPEELGKVRISLQGGDGVLSLQVHSERLETADLIRRHISLLQEELRQLGFGSVSIELGSGDVGRDPPSGGEAEGHGASADAGTDGGLGAPPAPVETQRLALGGLDLRV